MFVKRIRERLDMRLRGRGSFFFLAVLLLTTLCAPGAGAAGDSANFRMKNSYHDSLFSDVAPEDWYAENVRSAYELGLMKGSGGAFHVTGEMTLAETIAVAARIHSIYQTGGESFVQGTPWYGVYVDYALRYGILAEEYPDYDKAATRAEFASIAAKALPEDALEVINTVEDGAIPDVSSFDGFAAAVYTLYRAGVLTGDEKNGAFSPDGTIDRGSAAAILTRLADQSLRKSVTLAGGGTETLTAEEILAKCSPAICVITSYNSKGEVSRKGIGIFLTSSGLVVTDPDLLDSYSATVTLPAKGTSYRVKGICQIADNMIVFQVDGSGFSWLNICDYNTLQVGDDVYLIGNEGGKTNTIGLQRLNSISNDHSMAGYEILSRRTSDFSVLVSSDGGLIGVGNSSSIFNWGYANFYHPELLRLGTCRPTIEYWLKGDKASAPYPECAYIPDFGVFFNLEPMEVVSDETAVTYYYSIETMGGEQARFINEKDYNRILNHLGYRVSMTSFRGDDIIDIYMNRTVSEAPDSTLIKTKRNELDCIAIKVPVQGTEAAE